MKQLPLGVVGQCVPDGALAAVVSLASLPRRAVAPKQKRGGGSRRVASLPSEVRVPLLKRQRVSGVGAGEEVSRPSSAEFAEACVDAACDETLVLAGSPSWFKAPALIQAARRGVAARSVTASGSRTVTSGEAVVATVDAELEKLRVARRP